MALVNVVNMVREQSSVILCYNLSFQWRGDTRNCITPSLVPSAFICGCHFSVLPVYYNVILNHHYILDSHVSLFLYGQVVLDNPTCFLNPFQFEITFECLQELDDGTFQFSSVQFIDCSSAAW
jgi:hypothetical protein